MNGLFILGNKRSGTSHLSRLLNLHPEIFVSKESDVLWILSNYLEEKHLGHYPWDSPKGMLYALRTAGHTLSRGASFRENLIRFQRQLMKEGFFSERSMDKDNLQYIGDQKPYQNADAALLTSLLKHFPDSRFIHLSRHPFEVIRSAQRFHHGTGGYVWGALSAEEIFDEWCIHEQRVRSVEEEFELDILDIHYDDLIGRTEHCMQRIYAFLDAECNSELLWKSRLMTKPNFRRRRNYAVRSKAQEEMMEELGFKKEFNYLERRVLPRIKRRWMIIYINMKKKFKRWIALPKFT